MLYLQAMAALPLKKCKRSIITPTIKRMWTSPLETWKAKKPSNQSTIRTAAIIPSMSSTPSTERMPMRKTSCHAQHECRLRIRAWLRLPDKRLESCPLRHIQVARRPCTLLPGKPRGHVAGLVWRNLGGRATRQKESQVPSASHPEATAFSKRRKTQPAGSFKLADLNYSGDKVRGQPGFV
jgi:hypothetical protein